MSSSIRVSSAASVRKYLVLHRPVPEKRGLPGRGAPSVVFRQIDLLHHFQGRLLVVGAWGDENCHLTSLIYPSVFVPAAPADGERIINNQ
jgi:hypothetical protein